jgi:ribosomal-protein-alanine N-acetyltransferase
MIPDLETLRLILKPLEIADSGQIQSLFADWEILRYLTASIPWPYPPDGAYTWCRDRALPAMSRGDAWHWALRLKTQPDQLIGVISLMRNDDDNRGFWLGRPWQGRGLMTEASEMVTDYWFNELKFAVLRVPKAIPNIASRRISEKSGMRVIATEERDYISGRFFAEIWEITAEEWNSTHRLGK